MSLMQMAVIGTSIRGRTIATTYAYAEIASLTQCGVFGLNTMRPIQYKPRLILLDVAINLHQPS
jgi:hypothetical protein